jgi:hypothetical protein
MRSIGRLMLVLGVAACAFGAGCAMVGEQGVETVQPPTLDTAQIEQLTGLKGALNKEENVFKVTRARTDVKVTVEGRPLEPFMGLTSWAAFTPGKGDKTMVMGDLVLFADEVDPVMSALLDGGLAVTALHNHFSGDEPRVYFMHIGGEGNTESLARGVKAALDAADSVRARASRPVIGTGATSVPAANSITPGPVESALGVKGQAKDGMFKAVIGRSVAMPCGCTVGKEMGVNTWAALAGSDNHALIDGDFVTFGAELQPVLKALRTKGISIVAIHSHMEREDPHAIFLHYWGVGKAADLAAGVRAALDAQAAAGKK